MTDRVYYSQEAKEQARRGLGFIATTAFVLGAGVGAMVALLFAPTSGDAIRDNLANTLEDSYQDSKRSIDKVVKEVKNHAS